MQRTPLSALAQPAWPEYGMEAAALALFRFSACTFAVLLGSPGAALHEAVPGEFGKRAVGGLAMGLTAIALIRSPWGQQSGAHMNPPGYVAGGIQAFYFHDPDGRALEILFFPAGKGAEKWRELASRVAPEQLFLGIDHTAIMIQDTEASLRFYRDLLGFTVAGESENHGVEQERLNNVFGARLRITALRAASGPGIEFLEYQAPRDGRPYPPDAKANDLVHWQTKLLGRNAAQAARTLERPGRRRLAIDHRPQSRRPCRRVVEQPQPHKE